MLCFPRLRGPTIYARVNSRKSTAVLLVVCLPLMTALFLYLDIILLKASQHLDSTLRLWEHNTSPGSLDFVEQIYVVSLPDRRSRREDMEKLRHALGLQWNYFPALPSDNPSVGRIMDWVSLIRTRETNVFAIEGINSSGSENLPTKYRTSFSWPKNIDELSTSSQQLDIWSSDILGAPTAVSSPSSYQPIACATKNYNIAEFSSSLPEYLVLTPARVACWHSHLSIIHSLAHSLTADGPGVAFILEDDVDMEKDITQQLRGIWPLLPENWDIVFLGHCWSDERRGSPLTQNLSRVAVEGPSSNSWLYVSSSPKCTHAYALSRTGARRLLLHLRYPPFAYSRAIDQAFSWLVESGRLKSFSIVPSLVVQRKIEKSDVMPGLGSKWKESLINGVFNDST